MPRRDHQAQDFDHERIMDEWRRLYDWAVLSRKSMAFIEEVSFLGQRYSSVLNVYQQTATAQRRARLQRELQAVLDAMQSLYERLDDSDCIRLRLHRARPNPDHS